MILYTSMPYDLIFPTDHSEEKQEAIPVENGTLLVEPDGDVGWKIVRLISSNPNDYCKAHYRPGNRISMRPFIEHR